MISSICDSTPVEQVRANQLVDELNRLGVYFLQGESAPSMPVLMTTATLIRALASSQEARLRLALIPLLLRHPALADKVRELVAQLPPSAQVVLYSKRNENRNLGEIW